MTQRRLCALVIGTLLCSAAAAGELTDSSTTQITLHFAGTATHRLDVRDITGSIDVQSYDGQDVEMVVDRTIIAETQEGLLAAQREVKLETADNASTVGALVRYRDQGVCGEDPGWSRHDGWPPHYSVRYDFTIRVPRQVRLDLCTINQGDVRVTRTQGDFDIRSVNGRITMSDVEGSGNAETVNGPVVASFVKAPENPSNFKTVNGEVSVTMPEGTSVDLRMKTLNGRLFTDFEVRPQPVATTVTMRKEGGMYVYRTADFTKARIGNGGPELTLESLNGDVRIIRRSN